MPADADDGGMMLSSLRNAGALSEVASALGQMINKHPQLRLGVQAVLVLSLAVPIVLGLFGFLHPLMIYSSAAGTLRLFMLEVVKSV